MERLGQHYKRYQIQDIQESNVDKFRNNDYTKMYKNDIQLSTVQEPEITYDKFEYFLTVSSVTRDTDIYPDVSNYNINLDTPFKNIHSIELIQCIIPDKNSVTSEPYLLLQIKEVKDVMIAQDQNILNSFAILQLCTPVVSGGFINIDKRIHENVVKVFHTPISLSRISIKITKFDGSIFDFGGSGSLDKQYQNTFVFKIVCFEKRRNDFRNVY